MLMSTVHVTIDTRLKSGDKLLDKQVRLIRVNSTSEHADHGPTKSACTDVEAENRVCATTRQ